MSNNIPLFNATIPESIVARATPLLRRGQLAYGPEVEIFEKELGDYLGVGSVIATNTTFSAMLMALMLSGVKSGDKVISSPLSCASQNIPISFIGATPAWCDVNPLTGMMSEESLIALIDGTTKAVLLQNWSGNVADIAKISDVCSKNDIPLINDVSEGFGAEMSNRSIAAYGDFAILSFYPTKPMTTLDGGALICPDKETNEMGIKLSRYGIDRETFRKANGYINESSDIRIPGIDGRMTNYNALIGLSMLPEALRRISIHKRNGNILKSELEKVAGIEIPPTQENSTSSPWTFSLLAENREKLSSLLMKNGFVSQPLHIRNDLYTCLGGKQDLPGVEYFNNRTFSIPCGWWVSEQDCYAMAKVINGG